MGWPFMFKPVVSDRVLSFDIEYPRIEGNVDTVEVGLMDVRAADSVRITYDFDRDGWSIQQASVFEWDGDDDEMDSDWQEVAFIEAWAREGSGE